MRIARRLLRLPHWSAAPTALVSTDRHCGPLAAWIVLRHFRTRTSAARLLRSTGHSANLGTFTIGIAVALAEHGLDVVFHTDPDPDIQPLERKLYARAQQLRIPLAPSVHLSHLREEIALGSVPVVFYRAGDDGHFS